MRDIKASHREITRVCVGEDLIWNEGAGPLGVSALFF